MKGRIDTDGSTQYFNYPTPERRVIHPMPPPEEPYPWLFGFFWFSVIMVEGLFAYVLL